MRAVIKAFSADITVSAGERAVSAYISTTAVDRDGDVMVPQGCNSKDFQANPVVYFNHNYYYELPVGRCAAISREDDGITAKTIFAERPKSLPADEEWVPDTLFEMFQQDVIKGFSVGFEIIEARPASTRDIEKYGEGCRRVISKWRLYEYSVAPMPCNQEALAMAVSKGIVGPKMAKGVFNLAKKEESSETDTTIDGKPIHAGGDGAEENQEEKPESASKRVVRMVESDPIGRKRVHRVIAIGQAAPASIDVATMTKRLIVADLAKRRGQLYINE